MLLVAGFFGYFSDKEHAEADSRMFRDLKDFYTASGTPHDMRITGLTVRMVGDKDAPHLKLKAAKSRRFLPFIVHLLENKGGATVLDNAGAVGCEGEKLLEVGRAFELYFEILKREPRKMSETSLQNLEHTIDRAIDAWGALEFPFQMKWHALGKHFVRQCRTHGNVLFSHNFRDESENASTKKRSFNLYRPDITTDFLTKWMVEFLLDDAGVSAPDE